MARALSGVLVCLLLVPTISLARDRETREGSRPPIEIVGVFFAAGPITGAAHLDNYLYITTPDRLSIYDVTDPVVPALIGTAPSPRTIYGELISTDGETLLTNNGLTGGTLDVWNVEDKTNPVLVSTMFGVGDEHVSCLLECNWAYGSDGSIIDLRRPEDPDKRSENWKEIVGLEKVIHHRLDGTGSDTWRPLRGEGPPS